MKRKITDLSKIEEARWISLISAIDIVDEFCKKYNKSFNNIEIKTPAIRHYMNESLETFKSLQHLEEIPNTKNSVERIKNKMAYNFMNNIKTNHPKLATVR